MTYPDHCSLASLPPAELGAIVTQLESQSAALSGKLGRNESVWRALIAELRQHAERETSPAKEIVQLVPQTRAAATDSITSHIHRALVFIDEGKEEDALQAALQTLSTDPFYYHALMLIAAIRTNRRDFEGAEAVLDQAVALTSKHPEAYVRRAWVRCHQGRFADGLELLEVAQQKADELGRADNYVVEGLMLTRAALLYHSGAMQPAIDDLDRYLGVRPHGSVAKKLRAAAALRLAS